jgi:hypothetical protein
MRIVRAIQSASALAGAIFITFNQPNREITGTDWIGLIALIIFSPPTTRSNLGGCWLLLLA